METFSATSIFGAWNLADITPAPLPQKVATAFTAAFTDFVGANYEPILYLGKQVVNGTNYAVLCKQSIPYVDSPVERLAIAVIHEDVIVDKSGKPTIPEKKYSIANIQVIFG